MQNPHIIVDPKTKRCLCGMHGIVGPTDQAVHCADILAAMDRLLTKTGGDFDALLVKQTVMSVVEDRH